MINCALFCTPEAWFYVNGPEVLLESKYIILYDIVLATSWGALVLCCMRTSKGQINAFPVHFPEIIVAKLPASNIACS